MLQIAYRYRARVKNAGRERAIDTCLVKYIPEMAQRAGTTRCDNGYGGEIPNHSQLRYVIALSDAVMVHAIQNELAGAAFLCFAYPVRRLPLCGFGFVRITRVLVDMVLAVLLAAVDSNHDALRAETPREFGDQRRIRERWRVNGDLVRALVEDIFRIGDALDATSHAERDVDNGCDVAYPRAVDAAALGTGRNIVKNELVCALVAVAPGKLQDVADYTVIPELDTLDDYAVADVETGNYALRRNDATS